MQTEPISKITNEKKDKALLCVNVLKTELCDQISLSAATCLIV